MLEQTPRLDYYRYVEDLLAPQDIHEKRAALQRGASIVFALIAAIIVALVEAVLIYVAITETVWLGLPIGIHLFISAVLLIWSFAMLRSGTDSPFFMLLAVTTAFTGIFGAIGVILCILLYALFRQGTTPFKEWFELIFPPDQFTSPEETYNKISVGIDEHPTNYEVMPFMDVMEMGNGIQKRRALSKIMINFDPRLAPAVHKALRDPSNATRVQAATCVAKIESQFIHKLQMIEEARKQEPSNLYVLFALAKYYDDYAYTGLLDHEREKLNRDKAIETYKEYLEHDPNHQDAWMAIGRLLYRKEQWSEAAEWFSNAIERGWNKAQLLLWYMECLYRLEDYTTLRHIAQEYKGALTEQKDVPRELRDTINLWAK